MYDACVFEAVQLVVLFRTCNFARRNTFRLYVSRIQELGEQMSTWHHQHLTAIGHKNHPSILLLIELVVFHR